MSQMVADPVVKPSLLDTNEAAASLGICARTMWELKRRGVIPHVRILGRVLFDPVDLAKYVESCRSKTSSHDDDLPR